MRNRMSCMLIIAIAAAGYPAAASVSGIPLAGNWLPGNDCGQVVAWGDHVVAETGLALALFDPAAATCTDQVRAQTLFTWLAADGDRLYAADGLLPAVLRVFHRDGGALVQDHAWTLPSWSPWAQGKALRDGVLAMPSDGDLVLWDVSGTGLQELGRFPTGESAMVTTRDRVVYAVSVVEGALTGVIVDARGPGAPVELPWATDVIPPVGFAGGHLLGRDGTDLVLLDLTDPLQPVEAGRFDATGMNGFTVDGSTLMLSTATGWRVVDLAGPFPPQPAADVVLDLPWSYGVHGLCRVGEVVTAAETRGLSFHAAADATSPTLLARLPLMPDLTGLEPWHGRILLRGDAAGISFLDPATAEITPSPFLTPETVYGIGRYGEWLGYTLGGGLTFLSDAGDGSLSVHGTRTGLPGGPAAAADGVLYIAEPSLLRATDAADPVAPAFEATQATDIAGPRALVHAAATLAVAGDDELAFFRATPTQVLLPLESLPVVGVSDLAVLGETLYVASELAPLTVFRLSATGAPEFLGAGAAPAAACLAVGDGLLLAGHGDGVSVLDIADPAAPVWSAALDLGYAVRDLAVDGSTLIAVEDLEPVGRVWTYPDLLDGIVANEPDQGDAPTPPARPFLAAAPNPFNPTLRLVLELPAPGPATLAILDLRGRRVAELHHGPLGAGRHVFRWDGRDDSGRELPSGSYLARLHLADSRRTVKITLAR